jgi:hypothetical protein
VLNKKQFKELKMDNFLASLLLFIIYSWVVLLNTNYRKMFLVQAGFYLTTALLGLWCLQNVSFLDRFDIILTTIIVNSLLLLLVTILYQFKNIKITKQFNSKIDKTLEDNYIATNAVICFSVIILTQATMTF